MYITFIFCLLPAARGVHEFCSHRHDSYPEHMQTRLWASLFAGAPQPSRTPTVLHQVTPGSYNNLGRIISAPLHVHSRVHRNPLSCHCLRDTYSVPREKPAPYPVSPALFYFPRRPRGYRMAAYLCTLTYLTRL